MNWSRVKTILIFLFLAVDLCLLATLIVPEITSARIPQETIKTTSEVLSQHGIDISPDIIPAKKQSLGIVELYNVWPNRTAFSKKLTGGSVLSGNIYKKGTRSLEIKEDEFVYKNSSGKKTVAHELLDIDIDLRDHIYEEGKSSLRAWQAIDGKKLFESEIYASKNGSEITVSGYWVFSDRENGIIKNTPDTLLDVTGVLIDFISNPVRDEKLKITAVELGYSTGSAYRDTSHKLVSASPAYKFSTDNGDHYIYDALSGEFLYALKDGEIIFQ